LATSTDSSDDRLAELCAAMEVECFRGSLDDVLDRFCQAAQKYHPEHVVRLTGDCPLADPEVIDAVIAHHLDGGFDYTANFLPPTFPHGLDAEVIRWTVLQTAAKEAVLPWDREHVTEFVLQRPERFRRGEYRNGEDLSALRWTVDHAEDFTVVRTIYEALYPGNPEFSTVDIRQFLDAHPTLKTSNTHHHRDEAWKLASREDEESRK